MAVIARVSPGSAFKIGLTLYALIGLIVGVMFALISLMAGGIASHLGPSAPSGLSSVMGVATGVGAIIVMPIMYGVIGGVAFAITAFTYNLVAGWVGGLEVDIK
jgi:uncharacterized protein involved in cysteine biosynthesis